MQFACLSGLCKDQPYCCALSRRMTSDLQQQLAEAACLRIHTQLTCHHMRLLCFRWLCLWFDVIAELEHNACRHASTAAAEGGKGGLRRNIIQLTTSSLFTLPCPTQTANPATCPSFYAPSDVLLRLLASVTFERGHQYVCTCVFEPTWLHACRLLET
jgi:hypothetical protein